MLGIIPRAPAYSLVSTAPHSFSPVSSAWCAVHAIAPGSLGTTPVRKIRWEVGAEGPTIALRYMKDNLDEALLFDFATARDHEAERLIHTTMTADHREAVQAFIEKRKATFKGN